MLKNFLTRLAVYDWYLIINIALLSFFSLAALYSLRINVNSPDFVFFNRQLIFYAAGWIIFFIFSSLDYKFCGDYYKIIYIFSCGLLLLVLFLGIQLRGTTGWFKFFGQTFQPVELVKVGMVVFLAKFFSQKSKSVYFLKDIVFSALPAGFLIILILLQPDFGSAMILFFIWLGMALVLPLQKKTVLIILSAIIIAASIFFTFFLKDYQRDRLLIFIKPQSDQLNAGYNVRQSTVAVGAGGFFGRGLSLGSQSQLNFLPEQETDFIFAVIAEELGFMGAGVILLVFASLFIKLWLIGKKTADNFAGLLISGFIIYLLSQTFINIGMNLGIAPVTGVPLPLVSYGGSSLLAVFAALGIAHNIQLKSRNFFFVSEN